MRILLFGWVIFTFIFSCSKNSTEELQALEVENAVITKVDTMDWVGVYTGTVPNAEDIGLEMKLSLNPSNTYDLEITHLRSDPKDNIRKEFSGEIHWADDSTIIELREIDSLSNKFKIRPGRVDYLNPDATPNSGKLAEFYVLKKK